MKKIKNIIALVVVYLLTVALLPSGLFGIAAKADESIPELSSYYELYCNSAAQYKDEVLISYFKNKGIKEDYNYNFNNQYNYNYELVNNYVNEVALFSNGSKKVIDNSDGIIFINQNVVNGKVELSGYDNDIDDMIYNEYDFVNKSYKEISVDTLDETDKKNIVNKINSKFDVNYNSESAYFGYEYTEKCDGKTYKIAEVTIGEDEEYYLSDNKYMAVLSDDMILVVKGRMYQKRIDIYSDNTIIVNESKCEGMDSNYSSINDYRLVEVYNNEELVDSEKIYGSTYIDVVSDYLFSYDYRRCMSTFYKIEDNKLVKLYDESNLVINNYTEDSNKEVWCIARDEDSNYLCKIQDDKLVKKYKVDDSISGLSVYDEKNFTVYGNVFEKGLISVIIDGKFVDILEGNNNSEVVIPEGTLDPDGVNNVTFDNGYDEYEAVTTDIEAIKNGTGSLEVVVEDSLNVNIPFAAIDKALLENAKEVKVNCEIIKDSEIIKGLKAVNKVFDFNLNIEYNDGTVKSIHKFADGTAEITISLTDEELKGLDKSKLKVFYYNEETKKYEMMETKVNGNDITFVTNHFSKFIVAEANGSTPATTATNKTNATKTGDNSSSLVYAYIGLGVVALTSMAVVVCNKRKKENN